MNLQSHNYKNIPVSFDFITTWNQGVFLCSPCMLAEESVKIKALWEARSNCFGGREQLFISLFVLMIRCVGKLRHQNSENRWLDANTLILKITTSFGHRDKQGLFSAGTLTSCEPHWMSDPFQYLRLPLRKKKTIRLHSPAQNTLAHSLHWCMNWSD